ncbi:MAG: NADH-quinone oxidoreductase subunit M [Sporocytophaga sp.]|nr:NADH-quinone oxidoreductase subunit M [Sporocytophaga sp.]
MTEKVLSILIFLPLVGLIPLLVLPKSRSGVYKYINLGVCFLQTILAGFVFCLYSKPGLVTDPIYGLFKLTERLNWITVDLGNVGRLSINYFIGLDGLNVTMVLLSAIVMLIAAVSSWSVDKHLKGYYALLLILNTSVLGCFLSLDLFLFFLFFEFMLLPMYFLIGIWGGPRREYASIKFFLYTLAGSLLILAVIIGLYFSVVDPVETSVRLGLAENIEAVTVNDVSNIQGMLQSKQIPRRALVHSFNIPDMTNPKNFIPGSVFHVLTKIDLMGLPIRMAAFLALLLGFLIKLPAVPFHTWLPDAHVEAPTPVSVILAGILLKIGGYGLIRTVLPVFPEGLVYFGWLISFLAVLSIIYAAMNALGMKDLKKMIAYSSVSHMGFVLLGIASGTPEGINGAIFQMFSHGILSSGLFLAAGVLYDRTHDRGIENYRGLASKMPTYTIAVTILFFASLGLPVFSGFIGELFSLLGAFHSSATNGLVPYWMSITAVLGILIGATYFLWTLQRMFFGKFWISKNITFNNKFNDLDSRELIMLVPLIIITVVLGVFSGILLEPVSDSVEVLVGQIFNSGLENLKIMQNFRSL